jgi:CRISPR-associated endonuclease Cas1
MLPALPSWLHDLATLRTFEGRAAATYFAAWDGYPLRWRQADARRVPPHWRCIRERTSPIGSNARHAVDPANAILNYAYAVLEGQCTRALCMEGFDTACGILHADKDRRDSLVYDLMELYRPAVDARVLAFLSRTTLTYGDLVSTSAGQCRLHPQMARAVVAACRVEQQAVDAGALELRALVLDAISN